MGIGIVCEFQNLRIGIRMIFVKWEVFASYSQIPEIYFFLKKISKKIFFLLLYIVELKKLPCKQSHSEIYAYSLYIFNIIIWYSWILWNIFVNRNNICQITIFANRNNNSYVIKLLQIGIWIYLWLIYQQIDLRQIYLQTIC